MTLVGYARTIERPVSVWEHLGREDSRYYVADRPVMRDVWGMPMGLRSAPPAIEQAARGHMESREMVEWEAA